MIYSRGYRNVALDSWCVGNSWYDNRLEVILPEVTTLSRIPSYCLLLCLDQEKNEFFFFWPQETRQVDIHFFSPFFGKFLRRSGIWRVFWQNWKQNERIRWYTMENTVFLR